MQKGSRSRRRRRRPSDTQSLALQRAVARQRAAFGADGVATDGGSGQAVLLGLYDSAATEASNDDAVNTLKAAAINQGLGDAQTANMLELTQTQQKQQLARQLLKKQGEIF